MEQTEHQERTRRRLRTAGRLRIARKVERLLVLRDWSGQLRRVRPYIDACVVLLLSPCLVGGLPDHFGYTTLLCWLVVLVGDAALRIVAAAYQMHVEKLMQDACR